MEIITGYSSRRGYNYFLTQEEALAAGTKKKNIIPIFLLKFKDNEGNSKYAKLTTIEFGKNHYESDSSEEIIRYGMYD